MKKWTKFLAALMMALLICGMLAACANGSEVAEIKKSGKLVVLTSADFPPFEYLGEELSLIHICAHLSAQHLPWDYGHVSGQNV